MAGIIRSRANEVHRVFVRQAQLFEFFFETDRTCFLYLDHVCTLTWLRDKNNISKWSCVCDKRKMSMMLCASVQVSRLNRKCLLSPFPFNCKTQQTMPITSTGRCFPLLSSLALPDLLLQAPRWAAVPTGASLSSPPGLDSRRIPAHASRRGSSA